MLSFDDTRSLAYFISNLPHNGGCQGRMEDNIAKIEAYLKEIGYEIVKKGSSE
jgi:hypothetical protein